MLEKHCELISQKIVYREIEFNFHMRLSKPYPLKNIRYDMSFLNGVAYVF